MFASCTRSSNMLQSAMVIWFQLQSAERTKYGKRTRENNSKSFFSFFCSFLFSIRKYTQLRYFREVWISEIRCHSAACVCVFVCLLSHWLHGMLTRVHIYTFRIHAQCRDNRFYAIPIGTCTLSHQYSYLDVSSCSETIKYWIDLNICQKSEQQQQ